MKYIPSQSKSQFLEHFLLGRLDLEVYLDRLLRATTKKKVVHFFDEKVHPQTKSWLCLWVILSLRFVVNE